MSAPSVGGVGTASATAPTWPTHSTGDMGLLIMTSDTAYPNVPTGWLEIPGGSAASSTNAKLRCCYRVATSNSESAPTLAGGGSFLWGVIITITGFDSGQPFCSCGSNYTLGSTTSGRFAGTGTFSDNNLIVQTMAWAANSAGPLSSGETNSSLSSLTEQYDGGAASGGVVILTGTKATAGTVDVTTNTLSTTTQFCTMTLALQPQQSGRGIARSRVVNGL